MGMFERFRFCLKGSSTLDGRTLQYEFWWDARAIRDYVRYSVDTVGAYVVRLADGAMFGPVRKVGIVGAPPRDWGVLREFHECNFSHIADSGRLSPRALRSLSAVLQPTDLVCDFWPSARIATYRPLIKRTGKPVMWDWYVPNGYWLGRTEEEAQAIYDFGVQWMTAHVHVYWYGKTIIVHRDREFREVREFIAGAFGYSPDDVVLVDTPRFWVR